MRSVVKREEIIERASEPVLVTEPRRRTLPPPFRAAAIYFLFLLTAVALQMASGAYRAEFGGYPDEPAHYVTSVMVRDYVTHPVPLAPMKFAQNFYDHYPKVAFGHWPPVFYVVQAIWMILFSGARASIRIELALITAALAYVLFIEARRWFGWKAAIITGLLLISLPVVQTYTDEEMAETLLTLFCFSSAVFFARYLNSEEPRDGFWYAAFASLAILTKGNGWLLLLLVPIALPLTRKLYLLRNLSFWAAIALIFVLCLPWQMFTLQLADRGWTGGASPSAHYTIQALRQFLLIFIGITGPILSIFIAVGITVTIFVPMFRRTVASTSAVMFALILATWIFHSVVPAGVEDRKALIAVPALILFLFSGAFWVADRLPAGNALPKWRRALVTLALAAVFLFGVFQIPHLKHYWYAEAARFISSGEAPRASSILVSSESGGEGLFVSEMAMVEPRPIRTIIRGTKALAEVDWSGSKYRSFFSKPADVETYLAQRNIDLVVLDTFTPQIHFEHEALLKAAMQPGFARLLTTFPRGSTPATGQIQIFEIYKAQHR